MARTTALRLLVPALALGLAAVAVAPAVLAAAPSKATPPAGILTRADVPAALGNPKPGKLNYDVIPVTAAPWSLCTAVSGPKELTVPLAGGWGATAILTGKGYREVNEQIATYPTAESAAAAFARIQSQAAKCDGATRTPIDGNGTYDMGWFRNSNSTGAVGDGVYINVNSKVQKASHDINGTVSTIYTVYTQSGTHVVVTWLYQNGTANTSLEQRMAVNDLAAQLTAAL